MIEDDGVLVGGGGFLKPFIVGLKVEVGGER